ncbi:PEP-CTERM sorting domain-containing protein [Duganella sp. FT92W]|uniref:PEP-CTERM sorting domain-containing protein n=1 Tax=Pseudoduganella rivuli TaxID=2666085 RepID=A0A7X2LTM7_9BURK|nr:PEP-CTERM sorting domain-containing protein [Pseudoduganella rivuli]MRV72014.1 PEP-CTERM sorting domain-containing protein [Pseudoduganella rivuli]
MKKMLFAAALCLTLAASIRPAHALAISLFPRTGLTVHRFDDVFIDVNLTGLRPAGLNRTLGAFEVDLLFDPNLFQKIDTPPAGWGMGLGGVPAGEALASMVLTAPGILHLSAVSLLEASPAGCVFCTGPYLADLQADSFRLATVGLYAYNPNLPEGVTTVRTSSAILGDGDGNRLPDVPDTMLQLSVPEPGTLALLPLGLACAAVIGKRRRASARFNTAVT